MPALTDAAIKGKLTLVNVFASWCLPCRDEHPVLKELAKDGRLNIVAINYRTRATTPCVSSANSATPIRRSASIRTAKRQSTGASTAFPESYLVGPDGTILYKRVGPFDDISLKEGLFPAMEKALGKPVS
ncbi:redoxin family protein [Rhizobium beringeri]